MLRRESLLDLKRLTFSGRSRKSSKPSRRKGKSTKSWRYELMKARTTQEFFDTVLPNRFKPEKAEGINVTVQVNLSGPDGGDWVVEIREQKIFPRKGIHPSPSLTLGM